MEKLSNSTSECELATAAKPPPVATPAGSGTVFRSPSICNVSVRFCNSSVTRRQVAWAAKDPLAKLAAFEGSAVPI